MNAQSFTTSNAYFGDEVYLAMIDFTQFTHLTFDCYGTLIDWETGILTAVNSVLARHGISASPEQILQRYAQFEAAAEAGPYKSYVQVLGEVMAQLAATLGFTPSEADLAVLPDSVAQWPPFADTVAALQRLKQRYKLVIISNIDDALFAQSNKLLKVEFDAIVTAQQVGSYKPNPANFHFALRRLGVEQRQVQQYQPTCLRQAQTGQTTIQLGAPGAGKLGQLHTKTVLRKVLHS